eukprot:scaffold103_cov193-Alexandrium_tamarense.AAC.2
MSRHLPSCLVVSNPFTCMYCVDCFSYHIRPPLILCPALGIAGRWALQNTGASDILVGLSQGSRFAEPSPVSRFDFTSLSSVLTSGEAETASTSSDRLSA